MNRFQIDKGTVLFPIDENIIQENEPWDKQPLKDTNILNLDTALKFIFPSNLLIYVQILMWLTLVIGLHPVFVSLTFMRILFCKCWTVMSGMKFLYPMFHRLNVEYSIFSIEWNSAFTTPPIKLPFYGKQNRKVQTNFH